MFDKFVQFAKFTETHTGRRVKMLRSDNGGEYKSAKFTKFCSDRGIVQPFTPLYTPQLNGVAERINRTLEECARCVLEHPKLPKRYKGKAMTTATFLRNRFPTRAVDIDESSYAVWNGKIPQLTNLKVFGCHAYVHVPSAKRLKLDARSTLCRFLGYSEHEKAYRFEDISSGRIVVSRDAEFMEDVFDGDRQKITLLPKYADINSPDEMTDGEDENTADEDMNEKEGNKVPEAPSTPRREVRHAVPTRASSKPGRNGEEEWNVRPVMKKRGVVRYEQEFSNMSRGEFNTDDFEDDYDARHCFNTGDVDAEVTSRPITSQHSSLGDMYALYVAHVVYSVGELPTAFQSAMESSDANKWREACDSEYQSLSKNDTWDVVPLPAKRKAIGCK